MSKIIPPKATITEARITAPTSNASQSAGATPEQVQTPGVAAVAAGSLPMLVCDLIALRQHVTTRAQEMPGECWPLLLKIAAELRRLERMAAKLLPEENDKGEAQPPATKL